MNDYIFCSIWGIGPGRPFDNPYVLKSVERSDTYIRILFEGGEECCIYSPKEIQKTFTKFIVKDAERITWEHFYYGVPNSHDSKVFEEYIKLDDTNIKRRSIGMIKNEFVLKKNGLAFELNGNIKLE